MSNDNHITYLFGAGASYKSMPIVWELTEDILYWATNAVRNAPVWANSDKKSKKVFSTSEEVNRYWHSLHEEVKILSKTISQFDTIDTLARFYWIQNRNEELQRLKKVVDAYFTIRHFAPQFDISLQRLDDEKQPTVHKADYDSRYDSFFAAILTKEGSLSNRVKLCSYNYDLEAEQSLAKFTSNRLQSCLSSVYHINGRASAEYQSQRYEDVIRQLEIGGGARINYAWELLRNGDTRASQVKSLFEDTTHLVVIGYSFPVFNREIDRQILATTNLVKVYIQDLPEALPGIKNRVEALLGEERCKPYYQVPGRNVPMNNINDRLPGHISTAYPPKVQISQINSTDQFHIPFELI